MWPSLGTGSLQGSKSSQGHGVGPAPSLCPYKRDPACSPCMFVWTQTNMRGECHVTDEGVGRDVSVAKEPQGASPALSASRRHLH